jgi:acetyl-CoA synthetase
MLDNEPRATQASADAASYRAAYEASLADPDAFWREKARRLDWIREPTRVKNTSFEPGRVSIRWFEDGALNVSANCIDRHVARDGSHTAIIWEPDDPRAGARHVSYRELLEDTCRIANVLRDHGVRKGDRVVIYLPMIPEAAYAMLACARIGAIHSVVFAGFSPDALANRINDSGAKVVITSDFAPRGGKTTALKANTDAALLHCSDEVKCLVVKRTGGQTSWVEGRDVDLTSAMEAAKSYCAYAEVGAEDDLFILYTSGSTGKPKGVVHTTGGYLTYASLTHEVCFDYKVGDVWWCTADIGWVTGHSYIVYGRSPTGHRADVRGVPTCPIRAASGTWSTSTGDAVPLRPHRIRALMAQARVGGKHDLCPLKLSGHGGRAINPRPGTGTQAVGKGRSHHRRLLADRDGGT